MMSMLISHYFLVFLSLTLSMHIFLCSGSATEFFEEGMVQSEIRESSFKYDSLKGQCRRRRLS